MNSHSLIDSPTCGTSKRNLDGAAGRADAFHLAVDEADPPKQPLNADVVSIQNIAAVPAILDLICRATGMGFAAVARVTDTRWITCSVLDNIAFGLQPGSELELETTICHEIRQSRTAVIIDHVAEDPCFRDHHTPRKYGFQSYISVPIVLPDGRFFGTLCAIDPRPMQVSRPEIVNMFRLHADLIAFHIDANDRLAKSESRLLAEREMSELREQFIGVLGHDLRNPLGALSAGTVLLRDTLLDAEQLTTVEMMSRSVSRMTDLIDDALDFTRGRLGGGIPLENCTDASLEPVLRQVADESRAIWPQRVITAHFDLEEPVRYDRKRIAQLFTNLLSNAMTYGRAGEPVVVRARSRDGLFELSVTNAASPIPPAVMKRLFEPFQRGEAQDYAKGLGLGLYIAFEIAKSHGGRLSVVSDHSETRFTFTMPSLPANRLPTSCATAQIIPSPKLASGDVVAPLRSELKLAATATPRILLVEDQIDTLQTLTRLLTRRGFVVTPASGVRAAREAYQPGKFDLVISDLSLADGSGLDLISELNAAAPLRSIAMSGYGLESDIQRCKAAGFSEHLTKPLDIAELVHTILRLTSGEPEVSDV